MSRIKILFLFTAIFFIISCQKDIKDPVIEKHFFDLKSFFEKEKESLKNINRSIKRATVNGKIEEKEVEGLDFEQEFALFEDSDINKISWLDKYEVDSIFSNNELKQLLYKAKDNVLKTNQLAIHFSQNEVDSIKITRKTSSIAAELEQYLVYRPSIGYSIESRQQTSFSEAHVLELDVQYLR